MDRKYTLSVKCVSNKAKVYAITAEEFIQKMQKDNQTWEFLNKLCLESDKNVEMQLKSSENIYDQLSKKGDMIDSYFTSSPVGKDQTSKSSHAKQNKVTTKNLKYIYADDEAFNLDSLAEPKKITRLR